MRRAIEMERVLWMLVALGVTAVLGGCGRSGDAAGESAAAGGKSDSGGYARDLAAPPSQKHDPDIEANIKAGLSTDSKPKEEAAAMDAKSKAAQEQAKLAQEQAKSAKDAPAAEGDKPGDKDTAGDAKYKGSEKPVAAFQTKYGVHYWEFWPDVAPKTCKALLKLIRDGFYDGIKVHRVEPGFVVQAGDPQSKTLPAGDPRLGSGGPGFTIPAEFSSKQHVRGTLSMARTNDPNSAGSQFFIVLDRASFLDGKYSVFGKVLGDGMDQVDKIQVGDVIWHMWVVKDLPEGQR